MNLLPQLHIHTGSCATTFKFSLGTDSLLIEDALSVFEYSSSSKTKDVWAFRFIGNVVVVYSPPLTYSLEMVDHHSLRYSTCDPHRLLEWLPPYMVSNFLSISERIIVSIEEGDTVRKTNLREFLHPKTNSARV